MLITEQGLSFLPEPLSKSEPEFSNFQKLCRKGEKWAAPATMEESTGTVIFVSGIR